MRKGDSTRRLAPLRGCILSAIAAEHPISSSVLYAKCNAVMPHSREQFTKTLDRLRANEAFPSEWLIIPPSRRKSVTSDKRLDMIDPPEDFVKEFGQYIEECCQDFQAGWTSSEKYKRLYFNVK